jgi:hypothetical protein
VKVRNIGHKSLRRRYEEGDPKRLPPFCVDKLQKKLVFLEAMDEVGELRIVPI